MNEPIEETYFNWLYFKVARVDNPTPSLTYFTLFRDLHSIEFVWMVMGDDNRAEDGLELRREFLRESMFDPEPPWFEIGCSLLEMLIAFARRVEFDTDIETRTWFWIFLANLGLDHLNDAQHRITHKSRDIFDRLIWRTYRPDGHGGLFPMKHTENDQREVEIWYQFCEYLVDQEITF